MSLVSTFFLKIWHLLLSLLRLLRRAVCCRRKRHDTDMLLPMTTNELRYASPSSAGYSSSQDPEFQNWEVWNENEQASATASIGVECEQRRLSNGAVAGLRSISKDAQKEDDEDYFADMVPRFKKPKKIIVRNSDENLGSGAGCSSRLSMDPRILPVQGAELGVLEDNPSSWEDSEILEELWDPDSLIREKRLAEREKRLAEHQRRKLEKENRRLSKQDISLASKLS